MSEIRFNEDADAALARAYGDEQSVVGKIAILNGILGGEANFYSFGDGTVTDAQKLACLEYEYLSNIGLIGLLNTDYTNGGSSISHD